MSTRISPELEGFAQSLRHQAPTLAKETYFKNLSTTTCRPKSTAAIAPTRIERRTIPIVSKTPSQNDHSYAGDPA